ncbi:MAG: hypothetical protein C4617_04455 [Candidatus Liberibacter europaeus]|uniref:Uncharacterized protein n=1 Tax=Candidatus Liberibacter europaeus TaxID=744859 RepID=A0A2T4VWV7_9HYPH|nr:hypothetical protein [Candidatus Liberibacter europaeus]PTL86263.1 MAG: hypothetical protein C4617_04455 [Candidatus Liberibacter europaeus]
MLEENVVNQIETKVSSFVEEMGLKDEDINLEPQKEQDVLEVVNDPFHFIPQDDEHTRQYIANKKWQNPLEVITEVQTLEKSLEDSINRTLSPPDNFNSTDQIENYGRTIGRPNSPEEYSVQIIAGRDDEFGKDFRVHCHNGMLNDFQAQRLAESIEAQDKKIQEQNRAFYQQEVTDVRQEWGDQYDNNVKLMREGVNFLKIPTTTINQLEHVLGPKKLRNVLLTIGQKSKELGPSPTVKNFKASYPTAKSAQRKLDELIDDPEWIEKYNSGDAQTVSEHDKLNEIIIRGI